VISCLVQANRGAFTVGRLISARPVADLGQQILPQAASGEPGRFIVTSDLE